LANPPSTIAEALSLVGSQQWEAKDGAYIVPVQNTDINPAMGLRPTLTSMTYDTPNAFFPGIQSTGASKLINIATGAPTAQTPSPWSMSGVFFGGLDPAAVLTLNVNFYVERFPNKLSAVRRLCFPSPDFDPRALEFYSKIASQLPTGVPVNQNGFGDWIWGIAKIAGTIMSAIPHPIVNAVGKGLTTAATVRDVAKKEKKENQTLARVEKLEKKIDTKIEKLDKSKPKAKAPKPQKQKPQSVIQSVPFNSMYVPSNVWQQSQPYHFAPQVSRLQM